MKCRIEMGTLHVGLADLPVEIICEIAANLDDISTTLFALSSRWLLNAIGHAVLTAMDNSNYPEKTYEFLRLLEKERDGILGEHSLCPSCAKFHSPYKSTVRWNGDILAWDRNYRCRRRVAERILGGGLTLALPRRLTFNMVNAITMRHRQGLDVTYMLRQMNWTLTQAEIKVSPVRFLTSTQVSYQCKLVDGRLLVRTHNVWCPLVLSATSTSSKMVCRRQLTGLWGSLFLAGPGGVSKAGGPWPEGRLDGICSHRSWTDAFPGGFFQGCDRAGDYFGRTGMQPQMQCAIYHSQPCRNRCGLGAIKGCPDCLVDYAVSAVRIPNFGPALVFTTWDDFGCPSTPDDMKCADETGCTKHPPKKPHLPSSSQEFWPKHRRKSRRPADSYACTSAIVGDTFAKFEERELGNGIGQKGPIYIPQLSDRNVERLQMSRHVFSNRFKGESSYSDIPEPDPSTGLLEDPDPMEG